MVCDENGLQDGEGRKNAFGFYREWKLKRDPTIESGQVTDDDGDDDHVDLAHNLHTYTECNSIRVFRL